MNTAPSRLSHTVAVHDGRRAFSPIILRSPRPECRDAMLAECKDASANVPVRRRTTKISPAHPGE